MQFDLVAEHPHYRDHLISIWNALPDQARGVDYGIGPAPERGNVLLVAGYSDVKRHPHRSCVYVEHGAGQSYLGLPLSVQPYYSGGPQHRNVLAYLCPNDEVAARWTRRYDRPAFVVGCPKLDPWHIGDRGKPEPRTVAFTFHWEPPASVWTDVPELRSAFGFYSSVIHETIIRLKNDGWHVIGHAHPRQPSLFNFWRESKIESAAVEIVESSEEVLSRANVLIADNTSLQAEFLSLGRRVVWLNHPEYRTNVEHGGRFWNWPNQTGTSVFGISDLRNLDLDYVPISTWHPYAYADGRATERAVEALLSL